MKPKMDQKPDKEFIGSLNIVENLPTEKFKMKDFLNLTKFTLSNANAVMTGSCYLYWAQTCDAFYWFDLANVYLASLCMVKYKIFTIRLRRVKSSIKFWNGSRIPS